MIRDQIIYEDCMNGENGLSALSENSMDLSFFDPPYNAKKDYGNYKDNLPEEEYIMIMTDIVNQCLRISRKGIGVYVDSYRFKIWWDKIFPESYPIIIWKRSPGFKNTQNIFSAYHVILTNIKANKGMSGLWADMHPVSDGIYWRITGDYVSGNHPAQTSLEIVKKFVDNFSQVKDLILDPFMGTGSTAQACIELGRYYFGYEQNNDYKFNVEERLKDCKKELQQKTLESFKSTI